MLASLGASVGRHPRIVLVTWLLAVVAGFGAATGVLGNQPLFDRLHSGNPAVPGENKAGRDLLTASGQSAPSTHLLVVDHVAPTTPFVATRALGAAQRIAGIQGVKSVAMPYVVPQGVHSPQAAPLFKDGRSTSDGFVTVVTFDHGLSDKARTVTQKAVDAQLDHLAASLPGAHAQRGGVDDLVHAITSQVEKDLRTGEGLALPLSFVVMLVVFGGFLAAGMPLIGAIASIAGALASLLGFSHAVDLDVTVVNVVTLLGLGLCIDYGLLTVSRFREELRLLARGIPAAEITRDQIVAATAHTLGRAGRTVMFSGLTVAISLAGLLMFPASIMKAIGAAGVSVVVVAVVVALTLVPALCVVGARRLLRRGTEQAPEQGVFSRLAQWVHRRPIPIIVVVLVVLVALGVPALSMRLTSSGVQLLPVGSPQRTFYTYLDEHYPSLAGPDIEIVARATPEQVQSYAAQLADVNGIRVQASARKVTDGLSVVDVAVPGGPLDEPTRQVVRGLKGDRPPFPAYVTGQASGLSDFTDSVLQRAPFAIGLVALASLVLLFLMTGSVVIPVKALLLNVVSLGACLGVLVWVFQYGHLQGLLDFSSVGAIEATIPLLAIAFGFGLSMDYEMFLLSRIVELHHDGADNDEAVTLGLQRSGRIITSAAVLVMIVFSGFVAGKLLVVKETGVALTAAVLIDATLVRMLLVPATMTLLRDWNWWCPVFLCRVHKRFGVTE